MIGRRRTRRAAAVIAAWLLAGSIGLLAGCSTLGEGGQGSHSGTADQSTTAEADATSPVPAAELLAAQYDYAGAKKLGHGDGYRYPHDFPHGIVAQEYLPEDLRDAQ